MSQASDIKAEVKDRAERRERIATALLASIAYATSPPTMAAIGDKADALMVEMDARHKAELASRLAGVR